MALVLNATKEFCTDRMNPDSGGTFTDSGQISETDSVSSREPALYRCSFCTSSFPSLYHLQCHNVYKHSSILRNGHRDDVPAEPQTQQIKDISTKLQPIDFKHSPIYQPQIENETKIVVSESGALDLSTVRCRAGYEPKPECNKVSSSNNEIDDSDNDESDKLVIDTQADDTPEKKEENGRTELSQSQSSVLEQNERYQQNSNNSASVQNMNHIAAYSSKFYRETDNLQSRPFTHPIGERQIFENSIPSNEIQALDYRSKTPNNTHMSELKKENDTNIYPSPSFYQAPDSKYPTMDNQSVNQSLLGMIPPLPNMGMLGNFPMPFGFSPFMMMPPNSFMPPATLTNNGPDNRFQMSGDMFANPMNHAGALNHGLAFNPNLNLQQSKGGPVRRNSGNKVSRSQQKTDKVGKQKAVVEIYECKACNRRFSQVGNFHNHMKTHESKACACGICNQEFGDSYELQRHMRNTHTGSMPYKCEQCDREFSQYNNLRRHLRVHNGKDYKCHLCGRTFNEVFYLEMHMGSHTGERTYKCGVCNAVFSDNAELQKHVSTHSADELHTCNVCGKSFSKACVLRQHKKMHSGLRPFKCEVCDKTFIHRHHLTIHSRMHSTNKPYTCKICKKEFAQTSHLYKHIRQHTEQPGVTQEMIHESLAPILEKLNKSKESQIEPDNDSNMSIEMNMSDAINNNISDEAEKRIMGNELDAQSDIYVENEMKLVASDVPTKHDNDGERHENYSDVKVHEKVDSAKVSENDRDEEINNVYEKEVTQHVPGTYMHVKQIMEGTFKEVEKLFHRHGNSAGDNMPDSAVDVHEKKSEMSESDDNASDKTSISCASSLSEKRCLNSPNSAIPYDEQCLQDSQFPRIPSYGESAQYDKSDCENRELKELQAEPENRMKEEYFREEREKLETNQNRYSPISHSGDSLSEVDFRSRSNSACENKEPNNPSSTVMVSPRIVSAESILKEQHIPKDNCTSNLPPKKRRRYAPRQKKITQESPEKQVPSYQQMIQPLSAEAQQMYFIQLQQMQMALAANVMAAQGMMMQNASVQMKTVPAESHTHGLDTNIPIDLHLLRQPIPGIPGKLGLPVPMNLTKDGEPPDISRGPPFLNGSFINHSIAKAGYL